MSLFDPELPESLKNIQVWFGNVISVPLTIEDKIQATSPSGRLIEEEANLYIVPSPTLKPYERIQLYNQQYWWRLINTLQDAYPFLLRLFGYAGFRNEIAIPFLIDYPPEWSINNLGDRLPAWLKKNYKAKDRKLTINAAILDNHYYQILYHPIKTPIQLPADLEELMSRKLKLQPHISLLKFPFELFSYRKQFLKESVEYWEENPFPKLKLEKTYGILCRTSQDYIGWSIISAAEYEILRKIQKGISIEDLSEWLEMIANEISEAAATYLQIWFKKWSSKGYLIDANSKRSCISCTSRGIRKKGKD